MPGEKQESQAPKRGQSQEGLSSRSLSQESHPGRSSEPVEVSEERRPTAHVIKL